MGSVSSRSVGTLYISLENRTSSNNVYAYITGRAINNNQNNLFLLGSDGVTPYYPGSPAAVGSALGANCDIKLGGPGSRTVVQIPYIAGGRIWFCVDDKLTFLLNPGPALVEPSVSNPSDPNYNKLWAFCEFTYNSTEAFVNISYVDFVSLPIALTLFNIAGHSQMVAGLASTGLYSVAADLTAQNKKDGAGWDKLIVKKPDGSLLRCLSPNQGMVMNPKLFANYYDSYVNSVWEKYIASPLTINTQAQWGIVSAKTVGNLLMFPGLGSFSKPSTRDIFSCSSGPFSTDNSAMGNLSARLAAGFNRSTLLADGLKPDSDNAAEYYKAGTTNHYARIVHRANHDGRGYAFPYDDVGPFGDVDQSGSVSDGNPAVLTVTLGGLDKAVMPNP